MRHLILLFLFCASYVFSDPIIIKSDDPDSRTVVTAKNVTARIIQNNSSKPHHLFIGRCNPKYRVFHQEHIILTNDGKSHVSANIRMNVEGPVYITCVNVYDEIPNGEGGYPSFSAGGVGHNFVEFNVLTNYGKGFHFYVQIYGYTKRTDKKEK